MGEEIAFENGQISDFQGLVTLTLDRVILHTVMHQSSTSTYIPNFIEIEATFCGRTDGWTDIGTGRRTYKTGFIRSTLRSWPNNSLVGVRARAEARTSATEHVTLCCTWRPSALSTRPHGQVAKFFLSPECFTVKYPHFWIYPNSLPTQCRISPGKPLCQKWARPERLLSYSAGLWRKWDGLG